MQVAFIGLGVMGAPMAGHLAKAGHDVAGYRRDAAATRAWAETNKGHAAASVAEAVDGAEIVFTCVSADNDVATVVREALPSIAKGAVIVDHSTISARLSRQLADEAAAQGVGFVDAPVSGGQAGAQAGRLTVMAGGGAAHLAKAEPAIKAYSHSITLIGPAGSGQLAKMVNQICIAGVVQGLAEGLAFAKHAGIDAEKVIGAISKGAAQSWQMENRWKTMVANEFDFGFAVDLMRKDLGLVFDEARSNGADLPVATLVDQFYAEIQAMGGARWDTSSLIARLR